MKLKKVLQEIQAEIVGNTIPAHKIFSGDNISKLPQDSEWRKVLGEILVAIKKAGLSDDFEKDLNPLDISGDQKPVGKISLVSDSGKKYIYNVDKKKLFRA